MSSLSAGTVAAAYLDVVPNSDGYNHLALFSPSSSSTPIWLTSGKWELTKGVTGIDGVRGLVFVRISSIFVSIHISPRYFEAANPLSTSRHIYSVSLPSLNIAGKEKPAITVPTALTDAIDAAYYSAEFSPQAGFYLLSYNGPGVPSQKIVQAANSKETCFESFNARLNSLFLQMSSTC